MMLRILSSRQPGTRRSGLLLAFQQVSAALVGQLAEPHSEAHDSPDPWKSGAAPVTDKTEIVDVAEEVDVVSDDYDLGEDSLGKPVTLRPDSPATLGDLDADPTGVEDAPDAPRGGPASLATALYGTSIIHVPHDDVGLHLLLRVPHADLSRLNPNRLSAAFPLFLFWNALFVDEGLLHSDDEELIRKHWQPVDIVLGSNVCGINETLLYSSRSASTSEAIAEIDRALGRASAGFRVSEEFFNVALDRFLKSLLLDFADNGADSELKLVAHHERLIRKWLSVTDLDPRDVFHVSTTADFATTMAHPLFQGSVHLVPVKGAVLGPSFGDAKAILEHLNRGAIPHDVTYLPEHLRDLTGDTTCIAMPPSSCNRSSFSVLLGVQTEMMTDRFFSDYLAAAFRRLFAPQVEVEARVMDDIKAVLLVFHWVDPGRTSKDLPQLTLRALRHLASLESERAFQKYKVDALWRLQDGPALLSSQLMHSLTSEPDRGYLDVHGPVASATFGAFARWVHTLLANPIVYLDCPALSLLPNQRARDAGRPIAMEVESEAKTRRETLAAMLDVFTKAVEGRQLAARPKNAFYEGDGV